MLHSGFLDLLLKSFQKSVRFHIEISQLISEGENFFADSIRNSTVNKWGEIFLKDT